MLEEKIKINDDINKCLDDLKCLPRAKVQKKEIKPKKVAIGSAIAVFFIKLIDWIL